MKLEVSYESSHLRPLLVAQQHEIDARRPLVVTEFESMWQNTTPKRQSISYEFETPGGVALKGVRVICDGRRIEGALKEKVEARRTYEEAVRAKKTAVYLSHSADGGKNRYTFLVGGVKAGSRIAVCIVYVYSPTVIDSRMILNHPLIAAERYKPRLLPSSVPTSSTSTSTVSSPDPSTLSATVVSSTAVNEKIESKRCNAFSSWTRRPKKSSVGASGDDDDGSDKSHTHVDLSKVHVQNEFQLHLTVHDTKGVRSVVSSTHPDTVVVAHSPTTTQLSLQSASHISDSVSFTIEFVPAEDTYALLERQMVDVDDLAADLGALSHDSPPSTSSSSSSSSFFSSSSLSTSLRDEKSEEKGEEKKTSKPVSEVVFVNFRVPALAGRALLKVPQEIVMIVDRSGSMQSQNRMTYTISLLKVMLASISAVTHFNIVSFGDSFTKFFEVSRLASPENVAAALAHVAAMSADYGGTEILPALQNVLDQPLLDCPRQVFLFTDGEVSNTDAIVAFVGKRAQKARVFTFGIGAGASDELITRVAAASYAASEKISDASQLVSQVMRQLVAATQPTITNARITDFGTFALSKGDTDKGARLVTAPAILPPLFFGRTYLFAVRREAASASVANEPFEMVLEGDSSDPRLLVSDIKDNEETKVVNTAKHVHIQIPVSPSDVTVRSNNALHHLWAEGHIADLEASDHDHTRILKINHDTDVFLTGHRRHTEEGHQFVRVVKPYPKNSWVCNACRTTCADDLTAPCFHCTAPDQSNPSSKCGYDLCADCWYEDERNEAIRVSLEHGVLSRFTAFVAVDHTPETKGDGDKSSESGEEEEEDEVVYEELEEDGSESGGREIYRYKGAKSKSKTRMLERVESKPKRRTLERNTKYKSKAKSVASPVSYSLASSPSSFPASTSSKVPPGSSVVLSRGRSEKGGAPKRGYQQSEGPVLEMMMAGSVSCDESFEIAAEDSEVQGAVEEVKVSDSSEKKEKRQKSGAVATVTDEDMANILMSTVVNGTWQLTSELVQFVLRRAVTRTTALPFDWIATIKSGWNEDAPLSTDQLQTLVAGASPVDATQMRLLGTRLAWFVLHDLLAVDKNPEWTMILLKTADFLDL
jgi:hypothetical protein